MSFASVTGFAARHGHPALPPQTPPVFTSAPAIVGTPTVGQTLSYTNGIYTGNPTPSVAQHWARDGVDLAGATGATYTLVIADAGTVITVRQTVTNVLGSVNSTSAPVTVAGAAPPVFSSVPTISAAVVGAALSYTQGTLTGTPAPTITQQWTLDGVDIGGATAAIYTPVSGDATHLLRVRETATNIWGSASSTSAPQTVAAAGTSITSFTLTSATTQSAPFSVGVALKKGDATAVSTDLSSYQVTIKRTWNDGSIKHAIIAGRASLTANTPKTVLVRAGTAPTGTNLTSASITSAAPSASIQCGAFGTVNLSSLLASPFRTWISGPEMVECHYRGDVGGGTLLSAWFHVRLFADGRMWVRCIVENGYLDNGAGAVAPNASRIYVPTLKVNGVTVYNNGGASLTHYISTRYSAEGWIGTDPAVTPLHSVAYLRSTKLVPNYGYAAPSSGTLDAQVQTYTPMSNGPLTADMGNTGYQAGIGILPNWDALYCTTGDSRARAAVLAGSSSLNSYPIVWRSKTSNLVIKPSDFATWNAGGPSGTGGGNDGYAAGSLIWEVNHLPGEGYLAYLMTGDYWHLETLAMSAAAIWLQQDFSGGSGTSRLLRRQTRGVAWALRTVGQYAALAPDADLVAGQIAADYVTLLANNYTDLKTQAQSEGTSTWAGSLYQYQYGLWTGTGSVAPWMMDFWVSVNGFLSDIEPLTSATDLTTVRDWMYRWTVSRLGESGTPSDFDFTRAAQYGINVATSDTGATWYQRWGDVFNATLGSLNTVATNALQGTSGADPLTMATGYWGNLMPALTYAVDHQAEGAVTAWKRLSGATNFAVAAATFNDTPVFGTAPRSVFAPAYTLPSTVNTSTLIGVNFARDVKPASYSTTEFDLSTLYPFGGGTFVPTYSAGGAYVFANTGGHNNLYFQGTLIFDFADATWKRLDNANGVSYAIGPILEAASNGAPYYEYSSATSGQMPVAGHTYAITQYLNEGTKGSVLYASRAAICNESRTSGTAHKQDLSTGLWTRVTSAISAYAADFEGSVSYDRNLGRYYIIRSQFWSDAYIVYLRNRDSSWQTRSFSTFPPSGSNYSKAVCFPERRLLLIQCVDKLFGHDLSAANAGAPLVQLTTTGTMPPGTGSGSQNTWVYHPRTGKFYQKNDASGNTLYVLTPPANTGGTSGTWTYSTVTIAGSGLPTRSLAQSHYTCLQYVPSLDRLCWVSDTTTQVAVIKV